MTSSGRSSITSKDKKNAPTSIKIKGIPACAGIGISVAAILDRAKIRPHKRSINTDGIKAEVDRFNRAVKVSREQLREIRGKLDPVEGKEHSLIINTHILILEDEMFYLATIDRIRREVVSADWALFEVLQKLGDYFDTIADPYLKERRTDIDYVGERVLRNLSSPRSHSIAEIDSECIVVAHDLSPADTAQMNPKMILAFATDVGSRTSHTAIVARSLDIPAVVGLEDLTEWVNDGDTVIVDGILGEVIVNPSKSEINSALRRRAKYEQKEEALVKYKPLPSVTKDGFKIDLRANLELLDELPLLKKHSAEGVGVYRTEYLYLDKQHLPTEEEHLASYRRVVEEVAPHPVTIRTFDLGGDKFASSMELAEEMNPAMGLRAIRFCLQQPAIFKTQLRAILRASAYGNVQILFPMISGVPEVRQAKKLLNEVKAELKRKKIKFNEKVKIGIMIEVPAATYIADLLAKEVDFFSIGTNDLIQYTLAIDRVNEHVSYLYEPLHPAIIRTLYSLVKSARNAGVDIAMCGEMAGEPAYLPVLIGLGISNLSMSPSSVLKVKKVIRELSREDCEKVLEEILEMDTAKVIADHVNKFLVKKLGKNYA